jgi:hypothetical protein
MALEEGWRLLIQELEPWYSTPLVEFNAVLLGAERVLYHSLQLLAQEEPVAAWVLDPELFHSAHFAGPVVAISSAAHVLSH